MYQNELYHHGVLGMKWGVRRSQSQLGNSSDRAKTRAKVKAIKDGAKVQNATLKKRAKNDAKVLKARAKAEAKLAKTKSKYAVKTKPESTQKPKSKSMKDMSDQELRNKINRLQLEKQLKDLQPAKQVSAGKRFVQSLGKDVIAPAAKNAGRLWVEKAMKESLGVGDKKDSKSAKYKEMKEIADMLETEKRYTQLKRAKKNGFPDKGDKKKKDEDQD